MSDIPRSAHIDGRSAVESSSDDATRKKLARLTGRSRRKARSAQGREYASAMACRYALDADFLHEAQNVASFLPLPTEPDINALNVELIARGINVIVPVMLADKDLTWCPFMSDDDLGKDAIAGADVILTPALALGPDGERLGQGGGSYDRALPRRKPDALIVGVVFADELDQDFPNEKHDQRVHMSLTERGLQTYQNPPPVTSLRE